MQERLRNIPKQLLEWWNKFSVKQKNIVGQHFTDRYHWIGNCC